MPAAGLVLFSLLFGYYTQNWVNVIVGFIIGLLVWAFFYSFGKRNRANEP
jgi:cell shape-determining protein MreD